MPDIDNALRVAREILRTEGSRSTWSGRAGKNQMRDREADQMGLKDMLRTMAVGILILLVVVLLGSGLSVWLALMDRFVRTLR